MEYTIDRLRAGAARRRRSSGWRRTPAARWASTSCSTASTRLLLRRPVQARGRVPAALAAPAPPAGPRGVPGRRLLPPLAPARALLQAFGRAGRRLADGHARSSRRRPATCRPTSRRTSSRSPTGRSSWSPTSSTRASGPAINVGISVSRVGGNAQTKAMKKVAGRLRLDLSQYRELEAFSQFGSDLDPATQPTLNRGEKMVATLNQPQYQPWPMEEQVVAIFAGAEGFLDDVPTAQVQRFQEELREHLRAEGSVLQEIREGKDLPDDLADRLRRRSRSSKRLQRRGGVRGHLIRVRWPLSKTSGGESAPSATRRRSRAPWSSWRRRNCGARRSASRRCGRTPTGCRSSWSARRAPLRASARSRCSSAARAAARRHRPVHRRPRPRRRLQRPGPAARVRARAATSPGTGWRCAGSSRPQGPLDAHLPPLRARAGVDGLHRQADSYADAQGIAHGSPTST